jgi:putative phosphoribosyl transferase
MSKTTPTPEMRWTGAVTAVEDPPLLSPPVIRFRDRRDAGRQLAALLEPYRSEQPVIVAMPRGGVPVAAEVGRALDAPLDVAVVRKIGAPQNPEFAIGAVGENGVRLLSETAARALGLTDADVMVLSDRAEQELADYVHRYRGRRPAIDLAGRTVILIDDGLATGHSAHAALLSLRARGAARLILAVPVAAAESVRALANLVDGVVCVEQPEELWAVGYWYQDFAPTSDAEVAAALDEASRPAQQQPAISSARRREVTIAAGAVSLAGEWYVPAGARAVVAFAHGSGSGRNSPRNRAVATSLNEAGYATLLLDLLTEAEAIDRRNVFDVPLLASRLIAASDWLQGRSDAATLPLAYFGASTGAAAALTAAASLGTRVGAVVSRGGRPDLAVDLAMVTAPTLLIVGGEDREVLELNRLAQRKLRCLNELAVIPGAGHLFEQPGAVERVSALAISWLDRSLATEPDRALAR